MIWSHSLDYIKGLEWSGVTSSLSRTLPFVVGLSWQPLCQQWKATLAVCFHITFVCVCCLSNSWDVAIKSCITTQHWPSMKSTRTSHATICVVPFDEEFRCVSLLCPCGLRPHYSALILVCLHKASVFFMFHPTMCLETIMRYVISLALPKYFNLDHSARLQGQKHWFEKPCSVAVYETMQVLVFVMVSWLTIYPSMLTKP